MQTYFMDDLKRIGAVTYREFSEYFLEANQLCIFSSELTQHWRSRKEWVKDGKPDLDYLSKEFGNYESVFKIVYGRCRCLCTILLTDLLVVHAIGFVQARPWLRS